MHNIVTLTAVLFILFCMNRALAMGQSHNVTVVDTDPFWLTLLDYDLTIDRLYLTMTWLLTDFIDYDLTFDWLYWLWLDYWLTLVDYDLIIDWLYLTMTWLLTDFTCQRLVDHFYFVQRHRYHPTTPGWFDWPVSAVAQPFMSILSIIHSCY